MTSTDPARSYVLPLGFAMTVSMWAVAYFCRLPAVMAPSWLLLAMMLAAVAWWGWLTGSWVDGSWRSGVYVGAAAAVLNMLILGSLLSSAEGGGLVPSALWWIPGSILAMALVAGGFATAATFRREESTPADWTALFSKVAVAATFLLVVAGGLVTSNEAGLAVVDWPNTFGSNMFLYPLARMTGGIYYEHAHRLFGALVGLTMVVLAMKLWRLKERSWVRRLALATVVVVVVQGLLGGLRVTGSFTLSTSPEEMAPSIALAITHGVLGQIFLGMVVALAVVTSRWWRMAPPAEPRATVTADRTLQMWLVHSLVVQLVLGASQRHFKDLLLVHLVLGLSIVVPLALFLGVRAWGLNTGKPLLQRLGQALLAVISMQVLLGFGALVVTSAADAGALARGWDLSIATAHQWFGAIVLAVAVVLVCWNYKLLAPAE